MTAIQRPTRCLRWAALASILLASPLARGQALEPLKMEPGESEAHAAYRDAKAEYSLGHFRAALGRFEQAFKLTSNNGLLFNIAQCHRMLKEFDEAQATYQSFIRLEPDNAQVPLAQQLVKDMEDALRAQAKAQHAPPLADNGEDHPPPPPVIKKLPPEPPRPLLEQHPSAPPVAVVAAAPAPEHKRMVSYIALGAGGAALIAGGIFGLASKSTNSDITGSQHTTAEVDSLQNKMKSQATLANVLFIAGGVLAAAGGALFVMHY